MLHSFLFYINFQACAHRSKIKAHGHHVALAYTVSLYTLHRHIVIHMYVAQRKKTHTQNHCVRKCQICSLSLEVRCQMRFCFFAEHCTVGPGVISAACVWDWELQREEGSDEICCIRGCSEVWKRTGGSFFCHLALCAIFPIVSLCVYVCDKAWKPIALWVRFWTYLDNISP